MNVQAIDYQTRYRLLREKKLRHTQEKFAQQGYMFIDGMPKYDFTDLKFCVLKDYASFAELAAAK